MNEDHDALSEQAVDDQLTDIVLEKAERVAREKLWEAIERVVGPVERGSATATAVDQTLDTFAHTIRARPHRFDVAKIIAFDLDRDEPASKAVHECLREIEEDPYAAPIRLTDLVTRSVEDWQRMALEYQARHATLRALQWTVIDVTRALDQRNDPTLTEITDRLVAALGSPPPVPILSAEQIEHFTKFTWTIVIKDLGATPWPPPNESWAIGMREGVAALIHEVLTLVLGCPRDPTPDSSPTS